MAPRCLVLLIAGLLAACGGTRREPTHGLPPQTTTQDDGAPGFPMGKPSAAIWCSIAPGKFCTTGCDARCPGKQRAVCASGVSECNAATGCSCKREPECRCQTL